jgi:hypothetical protein
MPTTRRPLPYPSLAAWGASLAARHTPGTGPHAEAVRRLRERLRLAAAHDGVALS